MAVNTFVGAHRIKNTSGDYDFTDLAIFATTTGTATALTVAKAGLTLVDGLQLRLKLHVDIGANATLNINSTGAKAIKDSKGKGTKAGDKIAGSIMIATYNATAGSFFVEAAGGGLEDLVVIDTLTFTTTQTFIVPDGIAAIRAAAGGGGGRGGAGWNNANQWGGDGGAGFIDATDIVPVKAGDIVTFTIGAAGGDTTISLNGVPMIKGYAGEMGMAGYSGYHYSLPSTMAVGGKGGTGSVGGKGGWASGSERNYPGINGLSVAPIKEQWWVNDLAGTGGEGIRTGNSGQIPNVQGGGNLGTSGKAQIQLLGY